MRTVKGQTPLHVAVEMAESQWLNREFNYGLSVQLLVAAGSDVNAADSQGSTPLQVGEAGNQLVREGGKYGWGHHAWQGCGGCGSS